MTRHGRAAAWIAGGVAATVAGISVFRQTSGVPRGRLIGQVPSVRTPATAAQVVAALRDAGAGSGAHMIAAQSAEETAGWRAMWQWNAGNLQPTTSTQAYQVLPTTPPMRFAAYGSLAEGAAAMVAWVRRNGALASAQSGDLDGYVAALARGCYLGCIGKVAPDGHVIGQGDYDTYRAAMAAWMGRLQSVA